eukprot:1821013-Pleurochrysis_carterae.AAC.1
MEAQVRLELRRGRDRRGRRQLLAPAAREPAPPNQLHKHERRDAEAVRHLMASPPDKSGLGRRHSRARLREGHNADIRRHGARVEDGKSRLTRRACSTWPHTESV